LGHRRQAEPVRQRLPLVPYTPQHIRRLEKAGKFPRRIKLGENRVGWRLIDIEEWVSARLPAEVYYIDFKPAAQIF
jgi:prophage regulatory protein